MVAFVGTAEVGSQETPFCAVLYGTKQLQGMVMQRTYTDRPLTLILHQGVGLSSGEKVHLKLHAKR